MFNTSIKMPLECGPSTAGPRPHVPQGIDTPRMTAQLIHNVQIVHPRRGSIEALNAGILRVRSQLPPQDLVVQGRLHCAEATEGESSR